MSARANPDIKLRPFLPQDTPLLADIFRAAIEELTEDDYNPAQQEAWASAADDLEAFAVRLGKHLALIATMEGSPVGFISLDAPTSIDGHGVGATLYDAVEKLSAARGTSHLSVEASDTAREFFAHRGFSSEQRNSVSVGNEWLSNTTMKKKLAGKGAAS
jgi:putative acetyltransferase